MTYGNIYEYATVSEARETYNTTLVHTPCAYYYQAPVNGWHVSAISRVQEGLLLNTETCQPDWPNQVNCPDEVDV